MPHDFNHVLAEYNIAGEEELKLAADAAMAAKEEWLTCLGNTELPSS